jgi:hypothetical protein
MATQTRVYTVCDNETGTSRLVRAGHPSHALMHVARGAYSVRVASQDDLIDSLAGGAEVESIRAEQHELPET